MCNQILNIELQYDSNSFLIRTPIKLQYKNVILTHKSFVRKGVGVTVWGI